MVIIFAQLRAICVRIAYPQKLEVSSLSGDFKNAHRYPASEKEGKATGSAFQMDPCDFKGRIPTPTREVNNAVCLGLRGRHR